MINEKIEEQYEKNKKLVDSYFVDDAKKLKKLVDKILFKLKFNVDPTDFYSLADEVYCDALCKYDGKQDFNGFLYCCLMNRFKTEMTKRHRKKRKCDENIISIFEYIDENDNITIEDIVKSKETVESELFQEKREYYSPEMKDYLLGLSNLQRDILYFISKGFNIDEILEELHIDLNEYDDNIRAIYSYENTKKIMKKE